MCLPNACGAFYKPQSTAKDLVCPCGYRYWDIFQERFVSNPAARKYTKEGRALPREAHEKEVKDKKSESEFEASMRIQFAAHCISCGIRRRLDNNEKGDVGFDKQSLLRVTAEILEVAEGDFESRGGSMTLQTVQTSPTARNPVESSSKSPASAAVPAHQASPQQSEGHSSPPSRVPATGNIQDTSLTREQPRDAAQEPKYHAGFVIPGASAAKPDEATIELPLPPGHSEQPDIHSQSQELCETSPRRSKEAMQRGKEEFRAKGQPPTESKHSERSRNSESPERPTSTQIRGRLSPNRIGGGDENDDDESRTSYSTKIIPGQISTRQDDNKASKLMFLPQEGMSEKVLVHHQEQRTFGEWTSITRGRRNGKDGFLIGLAEGAQPLNSKQTQRILMESATHFDAVKKQSRNR